ncbi:MAG: radical SAM family heme chaperone HemW [Oscillospiraceae bacterium]|jgi:oxygen-independent coproporphyrinogen-3 oxidase|nr:radical SAM family heme chaperone HemW [Oscillospiraceae bacterium]
MEDEKKLGVYIHIPFCASKCAYCAFYSLAGRDKLMQDYQHALLRHVREYAPQLDGYLIDTVYFGGGTPSYYGAGRLISVLNALKKNGHVLRGAEITAEVNPDSVTREELAAMYRAGFNRLSVGVQSANDAVLKSLGRRHDFARAERAVRDARDAGFKNISVDLIYGLPSQKRDDWANTISRAVALKPEHISCYGLTIEEGTQLYVFKDSPFLPDDDEQADMYLYAVDTLSRYGYKQYEVSNFARRGRESAHNLKYWLGGEYLGLGAAAHSFIAGRRYGIVPDIERYSEGILYDKSVIETSEELSDFERAGEYLMLRLRTVYGISEQEYYEIFRCDMDRILNRLRFFETNGWAEQHDGRWRFTPTGFLLSNTLIGQVLEEQTRQRSQISKPWLKATEGEDPQLTMFAVGENRALKLF